MAETKLDALIRGQLLRWPALFTTRWDVLQHLYLSGGGDFEWCGGELVDVCGRDDWDEQRCRAEYFRDLDTLEVEFGVDADARLARARRQFVLDHLDDLVRERRINARSGPLSAQEIQRISTTYSNAFTVPDDAEPSFRAGALEVLRELMPLLHYASRAGLDRGLRAAATEQAHRLDPVDTERMARLTAQILEELRQPGALDGQ